MNNMIASAQGSFELFVYIVNYREGTRIMKLARDAGLKNSVTFLGHGTIESALLDYIGLNDVRKELVMMTAEKQKGINALKKISRIMRLDKQGRGIAFSIPITRFMRADESQAPLYARARGEDFMYEAIIVIVDKGLGKTVIETAKSAGSRGATLINAKGSGINPASALFEMEIEPEKEIILILSESIHVEKIIEAVRIELRMDESGNGLLLTCDVTRTLGLYQLK